MRALRDGGQARAWTIAVVVVLALVLVVAWLTRSRPVFSERCIATANGVGYALDPDQVENAALITNIGVQRGLPARAASIAIATAIQESKLRNIDYGDRDSVGLFQQRPSQGWGSVEEIMDPVYATNAFYDVLVKIEGYESLPITDAAQRVQRSGFPTAYADHEPEARAFASALSGHSEAAMTCRLRPASGDAGQPGASGFTPRAQAFAAELHEQVGVDAQVGDSPAQLLVAVSDEQQAWRVAHWAVAHAKRYDVTEVRTADRAWDRSDGAAADWVAADGSAGRVLVSIAEG